MRVVMALVLVCEISLSERARGINFETKFYRMHYIRD